MESLGWHDKEKLFHQHIAISLISGLVILCVGFHIGIVATLKDRILSDGLCAGTEWDFLVNKYEHQPGYLTTVYLLLAVVVCYRFGMRRSGRPVLGA